MVCKGFEQCHEQRVKISGCADCMQFGNQSRPAVKEKGVAYSIENPNRSDVLVCQVDGRLIKSNDVVKCRHYVIFCVKRISSQS